jgi:hypothetical protein
VDLDYLARAHTGTRRNVSEIFPALASILNVNLDIAGIADNGFHILPTAKQLLRHPLGPGDEGVYDEQHIIDTEHRFTQPRDRLRRQTFGKCPKTVWLSQLERLAGHIE